MRHASAAFASPVPPAVVALASLGALAMLAPLASRAPAQIVFEPPISHVLTDTTQGALVADVNGDGHADLISQPTKEMGFVHPTISVLLGAGDGSFGAPIVTTLSTVGSGRGCAVLLEGDAFLDLALTYTFNGANGLTFLVGHGDGTFTEGGTFTVPAGLGEGPVVDVLPADLTGDGLLDFAILRSSAFVGFPARVSALVATTGGRYVLHLGATFNAGITHGVVGEVTGDSHADVIVTCADTGKLSVLAGVGDGTFAAPVTQTLGGAPGQLALSDLDGDGPLDLAVPDATGNRVLVLQGDGAGHFATLQSVPVPGAPSWISAGPLDADGETDLLVSDTTSNELTLLLGAGDGTFTAVATVSNVTHAGGSALADFDEDGVLDAAVATQIIPPVLDGNGTLEVLRNHSYAAGSPFTELGKAHAGTHGYPIHLADGTLQAGTPVAFRLRNALPGGKSTMFVGFSAANLPFKGGTLVPFPNLVYSQLPINGAGATTLSASWPGGVPAGFTFFLQFGFKDTGASNGYTLANAVRAVAP